MTWRVSFGLIALAAFLSALLWLGMYLLVVNCGF